MVSNPILESPTIVVSLFVLEDHGIVTQVIRGATQEGGEVYFCNDMP